MNTQAAGNTIRSLGDDTGRFQVLNVQKFLVLFHSTGSSFEPSAVTPSRHPQFSQLARNMQHQCQHPSHWLHSVDVRSYTMFSVLATFGPLDDSTSHFGPRPKKFAGP